MTIEREKREVSGYTYINLLYNTGVWKMTEEFMKRRKKLGLTQRRVAESIGVTVQTVSNWETRMYKPKLTVPQMARLCEVMQTDIMGLEKLFEDKTPEKGNLLT